MPIAGSDDFSALEAEGRKNVNQRSAFYELAIDFSRNGEKNWISNYFPYFHVRKWQPRLY